MVAKEYTHIERLHNIILVYLIVFLQLRLGARRHCFYPRGWSWLASGRFRRYHRREWWGAAWDNGIANGVV